MNPVTLAYHAATTGLAFRHRHEQGVLRATGRDRLAWLNALLTNDLIGQATCYAAWLTPQGRMITDMFVTSSEHETLLEVPAPSAASLAARLDGLIFAEDARIADASAELMAVEVCGPSAAAGLEAVHQSLPEGMGIHLRAVTRPVPGVVAYIPRKQFPGVLEALTHSGATPLDDVTAEILRVEAGMPRFLVDMGEDTIPLEAGLDHAISHTKGCYVGQEIIVRIRDRAHGRVARNLVGLRIEADDVPAVDQPVLFAGRQVGRLTSAVWSIAVDAAIGLTILHRDAGVAGTRVVIGTGPPAVVTTLPFTTSS
jgi:folate-binding protein YgfZ